MGKTITIELTDAEEQALRQAAHQAGERPDLLARRWLLRAIGLAGAATEARAALRADVAAALDTAAATIARTTGATPEAVLAEWRAELPPIRTRPTPAAPGPFCGVVRSGDRAAGENDRIDQDLAAEYAGGQRID
jgi:hypothetical protein